jgi:hypothetical protein
MADQRPTPQALPTGHLRDRDTFAAGTPCHAGVGLTDVQPTPPAAGSTSRIPTLVARGGPGDRDRATALAREAIAQAETMHIMPTVIPSTVRPLAARSSLRS